MESPSTDDRNTTDTRRSAAQGPKILRVRNEVALIIVALSLSGAMVVVPRPTYPQILPLPSIDRDRIPSREREEIHRAISVRDGSLDKETRAIGEMFRRIGLVLSTRRSLQGQELASFQKEVTRLLAREASEDTLSGTEALLRLRALQGQLFLDSVRLWLERGEENADLQELGGPFISIAKQAWVEEGKMVLDEDELRLLFRVHWGKLTGLHGAAAFGPSLEELRRYYLTNLQHPAGPPGDLMTQTMNQIGLVRALGKVDSTYPAELAEGILQLRLGESRPALENLRAHLEQHPNGPWTHLARNHLILARRQAREVDRAGP